MKKLIFTLTCILLAIPCQARIIYVDWDGSGDYLTIQAAINDANDGDTIIVADGTYTGDGNRDIDFLGKAITLRSTDPNDPNVVTGTIIDCQGSLEHPHRGFYLHNSEDANSVLAGFTITNGVGHPIWRSGVLFSEGGAIFCDASSPTISQCNITGNVAQLIDGGTNYWYGGCGGGIRCYGNSNPTIRNCTITNNFAGGGHQNYGNGGGISCSNSSPTIICCTIADNSTPWSYSYHGGGGIFLSNSSIVSNCIISGNSSSHGGGIYSQGNNVIVTNCTFNCNSSHWGGGGIYLTANSTVTNCIFWDDMPNEILVTGGWSPAITYSDIQGGWLGVGNIDVYPCFADPCSGDYHLQSEASRWDPNSQSWVLDNGTSPCIDAGNPGCPLGDEPAPNGNRRNMGAYGGTVEASKPPTYWRSIADMTNDWIVDSNDLKVFVGYWLETGECIPSDLNRSQSVDFNDFAIFGLQWSYPSVFEPGMTFQIDDCNMEAGLNWTAAAESNEPRFSVWVEGRYIHFEDSMYANCCPFELWLEKEINGNQITLYEIGYDGVCDCMCYFPITATLGPFEDGNYTVEVFDNYGNSLGVVEVTIGGSPEPGITFRIDECDMFSRTEQSSQARFSVTVDDLYIHFEDKMTANCCPDELGLEMMIEDDVITIYETEYTPNPCRCICFFPVTATLGPFEPGIYTLEVYETMGGFIGSTTVVIDPPQ